jgi:hypothetical protein
MRWDGFPAPCVDINAIGVSHVRSSIAPIVVLKGMSISNAPIIWGDNIKEEIYIILIGFIALIIGMWMSP